MIRTMLWRGGFAVFLLFSVLSGLGCGEAQAATSLLAAGGNHSAVTKSDGTLWAWGENGFGQIGDGGNNPVGLPSLIAPEMTWMAVAKGYSHTVAIRDDFGSGFEGSLWAWGDNTWGQLGDGTQATRLLPKQIGTDSDWAQVAAGGQHTLALKSDGTLWAWGGNLFGQLGDGTNGVGMIPQRVGDLNDRWLAVAAGENFSLAIRNDGRLYAWGSNSFGQLGDGTTFSANVPQPVVDPANVPQPNPNSWQQVSAGYAHVLAQDTGGTLWTWGMNSLGQLGDGTIPTNDPNPLPRSLGGGWRTIAAGGRHSAAIRDDGSLWLWGSDAFGQLGDGASSPADMTLAPTQLGGDTDWTGIAAGENHTLGLKGVQCQAWGDNAAGQLGNNWLTAETPTPLTVIADVSDVTPPLITIDQFVSPTNQTAQTIGGTVGGNVILLEITTLNDPDDPSDDVVQPVPFAGGRWSFDVTGLVPGSNAFVFTAVDDSANLTTLNHTIYCDLDPPQVFLDPLVDLAALPQQEQVAGTFGDQFIERIEVDYDGQIIVATLGIRGIDTWGVPALPLATHLPAFRVRAFDAAGNSTPWISSPGVPLVSGATLTNDQRSGWNWTSAGGTGDFRVTLYDHGAGTTLSWGTMFSSYAPAADLAEGDYSLAVQERDGAGNWSLAGWLTKTIDLTPPVVTITAPVAGSTTNNPLLTYTLSEPGSAVVYADGAPTGWQSGDAMSFAADGAHTIMVVPTDVLGNTTGYPSPYAVTFNVDTTPPGLDSPGDILTNSPTASFFAWGWVEEETAAVTIATDTAASDGAATILPDGSGAGNWVYTIAGLVEGPNVVTVKACDALSNCATATFTITYDTTPPNAPAVSGATPTGDTTPTWNWSSGGAGGNGTYRYALDGGIWSVPAAVNSFTPGTALAEGFHRLEVQESDDAGNWSAAGWLVIKVEIDLTPPNPPRVTGPPLSQNLKPTWSWSSGGGGSGVYRFALDGTAPGAETQATSYAPAIDLVPGPHVLTVQERDAAGNWSSPGWFEIVVDPLLASPPVVSGSVLTNNPQPTWTWTSGGGVGIYRFVLDNGAATIDTITAFTPAAPLAEGVYTLTVQEQDGNGNWSAHGWWSISVDLTAPAAPLVAGSRQTNTLRPLWSWISGGGGNGTYRYQLDSDPPVVTAVGTFTPGADLDLGAHTLVVQEQDAAGNWSLPATFVTTIDLALANPPTVTGMSVTNDPLPSWSWSTGGGGGTYRYALNGGAFSAGGPETSFVPAFAVGEGTYLFTVQEEAVGSWSADGWFVTVVDLTPPLAPHVTGATATANPRPTWSWTSGGGGSGTYRYQLDGASVTEDAATSFTPGGDLSAGSHTLVVQERDAAGNWSAFGVLETLVDPQIPASPLLNSAVLTGNAQPTWSWSSGGGGDGHYRYALDPVDPYSGSGFVATTSLVFTPAAPLSDGPHTLAVQEGASVNGPWSESALLTVVVDTVTPLAPAVFGTSLTNNPQPQWNWIGQGGGIGLYRYTLDSGAPVVTSATVYLPPAPLTEGTHVLLVEEQDAAGNWSPPGQFATAVDLTPPTVTLTSPADGAIYLTTSLPINYAASEPLTGLGFVDGSGMPVGSPLIVPTSGVYRLTAQGTDLAGNPFSTTVTFTVELAPSFTLDPPPPLTNLPQQLLGGSRGAGLGITVQTLNGAACIVTYPDSLSWQCLLAGLEPGNNHLIVQAVDQAGNLSLNSQQGDIFLASLASASATVSAGSAGVTVPAPYSRPVVILGPATRQDVEPVTLRVANLTPSAFAIQLDEWSGDNAHGEETVPWLLLEAGRYVMPDGAVWEIGTFPLGGNATFAPVTFAAPFAGVPQVFLTVQTRNDAEPVAVRINAVTTTGFAAALFAGEGRSRGGTVETVGYLAIYQPQASGNAVFGSTALPYLVQTVDLSSQPRQLLGSNFYIEEETSGDSEMTHALEQVALLALGAERFGQIETLVEADPATLRAQPASNQAGLEWGQLMLHPGLWATVPLSGSKANPVVVVKSFSGANGGVVELRNVTGSSFDMRFVSWSGATDAVKFFYLVAPAGISTFAGLPVEAGALSCSSLLGGTAGVPFATSFTSGIPALFAGVQSPGSDGPLLARLAGVASNGFQLAMQGALPGTGVGTGCSGGTVGWIAVGRGVGATADVPPHHVISFRGQAGDLGTEIDFTRAFTEIIKPLIQGTYTSRYPGSEYSYGRTVFDRYYFSPTPVLIGDLASMYDADPAQLYLDALSARQGWLRIREAGDAPHALEDLSLLLIE